ncbi:MAG: hypothetical protein KVP17_000983 [Porospora cf. gigantea B]|uniref:uncharacterized protein n=1 Tax=Porospora cf. gigantea B TaxID=2853592 RepID=UPI003571AC7E|nr:MAG: hypothetical protein KVP17_000983 [Porospora cf. gigantea B]
MSRFVRWPHYIRLQRQKCILAKRLKIPPALNQFNYGLDKNQSARLLSFLAKYSPPTKAEWKEKVVEEAKARADGKEATAIKKHIKLAHGPNAVCKLIEQQRAKLVVIAHDVTPVEMVVWLPALCRRMNVPYCIVKGKARLGQLIHRNDTSCVALEVIKKEDQATYESLKELFMVQYNNNTEIRRRWGGQVLSKKSMHKIIRNQKALEKAGKLKK